MTELSQRTPGGLCFGKREARKDSRDKLWVAFRNPLVAKGILTLPPHFGHAKDFTGNKWLMLGNGPEEENSGIPENWTAAKEGAGDCFWAKSAHVFMEMAINTGRPVPKFNAKIILEQYAEYVASQNGGKPYNPVTGEFDEGTDLREGLKWLQEKGLRDLEDKFWKIGPYWVLEPKNIQHALETTFICDYTDVGIEVPATMEPEFNEGDPINDEPESQIEGLHSVPFMGHPEPLMFAGITWAERARWTYKFYEKRNDESYGVIMPETYKAETDKTYEGFDEPEVEACLQKITLKKMAAA